MRKCLKSSELGNGLNKGRAAHPQSVTLPMVLPVTVTFQQYEAAHTGQRSGNSRSFQRNRHRQERLRCACRTKAAVIQ